MLRDRRSEPRLKALKDGKVFTSSAPAMPCSVIELSERGARLLFTDETPAGDDLLLILEDGRVRVGIIRWRRGRTVGVEYTGDPNELLN
jgi:hypothetical protein